MKLDSLRVADLQSILRSLGTNYSGTKYALQTRLIDYYKHKVENHSIGKVSDAELHNIFDTFKQVHLKRWNLPQSKPVVPATKSTGSSVPLPRRASSRTVEKPNELPPPPKEDDDHYALPPNFIDG
jgi:hypothetical protein